MYRFRPLFPLILFGLFLKACTPDPTNEATQETASASVSFDIKTLPAFSADSAYHLIEKQVAFGPRVPNTKPHEDCAKWMVSYFAQYCDTVIVQEANVRAFDNTILKSKNIIASFNLTSKDRIMLSAHWDTRPFADQDSKDQDIPIAGANDGGSGVAVLMELARVMAQKKPTQGIDIFLWDAEDYGQPENSKFPEMKDSYCLGSQYWAKNPHQKDYTAQWGILLDMVGAVNATFMKEQQSVYYAGGLVERVWNNAATLGYASIFQNKMGDGVIDDHVYINTLAHIPTIDIIHRTELTRSGFGSYWHTHNDNMQSIDKNVLKAVGETLLYTIYAPYP
jgi:glutaminyl-peptide cyclotransferase